VRPRKRGSSFSWCFVAGLTPRGYRTEARRRRVPPRGTARAIVSLPQGPVGEGGRSSAVVMRDYRSIRREQRQENHVVPAALELSL
jgi:hypothetical protein